MSPRKYIVATPMDVDIGLTHCVGEADVDIGLTHCVGEADVDIE